MTRYPHLVGSLVAVFLIASLLIGGGGLAWRAETAAVDALGAEVAPQKSLGVALQRAAFARSDLLPMYGASELTMGPTDTHPTRLFATYPTGFNVWLVARTGMPTLEIAQMMAAVGPALRGRKVVITLTPLMFYGDPSSLYYAGNYSPLHGNELIFSLDLSYEVKQAGAQGMLRYPETLANDTLLRRAALALAEGGRMDRLLYQWLLPLGRVRVTELELQDHYEAMTYLTGRAPVAARKTPAKLDWPALQAQAAAAQAIATSSNLLGIDNGLWSNRYQDELAAHKWDGFRETFATNIDASLEWSDLDVLLRVLKELGADPLILAMPHKGAFLDTLGIPREQRAAFYQKMRQAVAPYPVRLYDFAEYEDDRLFCIDIWSHPSGMAWAYMDELIDDFYHDRLP